MFLDIYNMVKEVYGVLPIELEWVYGVSSIIVFVLIMIVIFFPFVFLYSGGRR